MMEKISDKIRYVGVNDIDKELFEGLWPLPFGVSYNSYLVIDEKIALIDTVEGGFEDEFMANIKKEIGDRKIDFLVINHMEPDHSSLISFIKEAYPDVTIVTNAKAVPMIKGYQNCGIDNIHIVAEGDRMSLGSCELQFFMAPMVHWPETMVTWLASEGTLFSGDAFGTFGALTESLKDGFEYFCDEMTRYYSNIVGKYGTPVQTALKKLSALDIKRICSTHGPVWENEIADVVRHYDRLSRYEAEHGVCIVYGSMYGNTAAAAMELAESLERIGVPYALHDLAGNNEDSLGISGALRDTFRFDTIAVGSPTYNNGIFPPVETFMRAVASRLVKSRRFYAFGSYTWSGVSVRKLNEMAQELGFEIINEGGSFAQAYSTQKLDLKPVAELMKNRT
jgi:flavorubredoxin